MQLKSFYILSMIFLLSAIQVGVSQAFPVILDTDIGSDIDDTWALSLLLCSPEVDLKLVVTDSFNTTDRAKIVAQFLERVRRTDVAVGLGIKKEGGIVPQAKWAETYDLGTYPGSLHEDGISAMIEVIHQSPTLVTLIVIGPCSNIPVLLQRAPDVVKQVKVIAMSGSVNIGYKGRPSPDAEYNVREDVRASQQLYSAGWSLTIAPLDVCSQVQISGAQYQNFIQSQLPVINILYENYKTWAEASRRTIDYNTRSTILYDLVAVYLSLEEKYCEMKTLNLRVDQRGYTVVDPKAHPVRAAMGWKSMDNFKHWVLERLRQGVVKKGPGHTASQE